MARGKKRTQNSSSIDPSTQGIKGNEEADILAKLACSKTNTFKKSTRAYAL
jgi:hypothetical protein